VVEYLPGILKALNAILSFMGKRIESEKNK
jgi:hypothetical protein